MALGRAQVQQGFDDPRVLLGDRLREGSVYRLLADHGQVMFPDDYFADLYAESARGRPTVPARVVATVMLLQAFEGISDREACDRLEFDLRWQAAAGADAGCRAFHPTVLVGMRNKLRASARPRPASADPPPAGRTPPGRSAPQLTAAASPWPPPGPEPSAALAPTRHTDQRSTHQGTSPGRDQRAAGTASPPAAGHPGSPGDLENLAESVPCPAP